MNSLFSIQTHLTMDSLFSTEATSLAYI